ncbi:addiction module protein [Blastopirellula sp. JC732]|uniref:Addiction module protein n=1 Tax=Blastopirellula sediminis TaxID=2894196 RepID=A0A9X1MRV2_9BACT|nr:addiction module protein [Blastopirellula sediminis]MCC9605808.1 addiction module protein [Blastopirellula sediminis]MCC9630892.1 addiction module protein [Blastopirellula sediminis]
MADIDLTNLSAIPVDERIRMAQAIWDSIPSQHATVPLSTAQKEELRRRQDAYLADPENTLSWQEVQQALEARRNG